MWKVIYVAWTYGQKGLSLVSTNARLLSELLLIFFSY